MEKLNLKPTHRIILNYYETLQQYKAYKITHEGAVSNPFAILLDFCAKKMNATFVPQYQMRVSAQKRIIVDGAILDEYGLPIAYWEAKDMDDDLTKEIQKKRRNSYPFDNILFQNPQRAILYQDNRRVKDLDLNDPENLIEALQSLFSHSDIVYDDWYNAVANFKDQINALATELQKLVVQEYKRNTKFQDVFDEFYTVCRLSINPKLNKDKVEEMLIQHILTERIFRKVFEKSDFANRNIIAVEIEKVSAELMRQYPSRDEFLKPLDRYYNAIEHAAERCRNFSQKQHFLNTVYERFFQDFSGDIADTHGIVYTPQPIVDFMVNSVEYLLKSQFDRSLSNKGVHIIDPFVGTGNFVARLMHEIKITALEEKYQRELHCNEVLLLPYYIANLNIEQEFWERARKHLPFKGIVFADTFELFDRLQGEMFTEENTKRIEEQKKKDMFVVIGNPPYNAGQKSENDNNKNRTYDKLDQEIRETYSKDSKAQLIKVYDPFVRAFKWASKRIENSGVVAFVTNNSFIKARAFDGMRKHLAEEFNALYLINLGGDINKKQPAGSNVFDIKVGVSIAFLIKTGEPIDSPGISYNNEAELWSKAQTFDFLNKHKDVSNVTWEKIDPSPRHVWLSDGLHNDFEDLTPMGTTEAKKKKRLPVNGVVFRKYSLGVSTNRDAWVYNYNQDSLRNNVRRMMETYAAELDRWRYQNPPKPEIDDFVLYDDTKIKWSSTLKKHLEKGSAAKFTDGEVRNSLYRPFTKKKLFLSEMLIDRLGLFQTIFPTPETESENRVICVNSGSSKTFHVLMSDVIPDLHLTGDAQCFPFYTYSKDGRIRHENITDWALEAFQNCYGDSISKWDIFYYNYGILHHSGYRDKYRENLKDSLPHILFPEDIPSVEDFWTFAKAGEQLANLHINYDSVLKYDKLTHKETPNMPVDWHVEKMVLSRDKTQIRYNDFLTIENIPVEAHTYTLGGKSALEWIVDQYAITEDYDKKRNRGTRIVNDPNRKDEPLYILELIERVITVSLETVKIIKNLPTLHHVDES